MRELIDWLAADGIVNLEFVNMVFFTFVSPGEHGCSMPIGSIGDSQ